MSDVLSTLSPLCTGPSNTIEVNRQCRIRVCPQCAGLNVSSGTLNPTAHNTIPWSLSIIMLLWHSFLVILIIIIIPTGVDVVGLRWTLDSESRGLLRLCRGSSSLTTCRRRTKSEGCCHHHAKSTAKWLFFCHKVWIYCKLLVLRDRGRHVSMLDGWACFRKGWGWLGKKMFGLWGRRCLI